MTKDSEKNGRFGSAVQRGIEDTFYIWKEELKNVFRDTGVMIFFFLVPLAYPLIYSFIYTNEVVRNAQLVVVDQSETAYSRELVRKIDATPDVKVVAYCPDMHEAKQMLDEKKAYGILFIPESFSKDLHTGKQTTLSLYSDMSALLYYKNFLMAATGVALDMGKEIVQRLNPSETRAEAQIAVDPIPYESVALYNPHNGFGSFLVPAILILVIQQTLILGICMLSGTAREKNDRHTLVPADLHYHGTLRIVLGKSLAYILLYIIVCCWTLVIVPALYNFPQPAHPGAIILFILPYLFACIFFSMTVSGFVTGRESPMLLFVFTSVILLFISGISWPAHAIGGFWKAASYIFPSTPAIQGFVAINSMGATLGAVAPNYKILWLQAGVYFILACIVYRHQIIRIERKIQAG
ncbi:MAG: ABC transporter permease [Tannerella sp.]|jgi:ABC-2 type transport system permease protein|nr:ABC transporter permease [Tannerella sp.]